MKKILTFLTALIVTLCGYIMVGCNENYNNLSLSLSVSSIDLTLNDEEKFYVIKINNYFKFDAHFKFDMDLDICEISNATEFQPGEYRFGIRPLVRGSTTLTIILLEGNKKLSVPVRVAEELQGFSLKENIKPYVLQGKSITFDPSMFKFNPETTFQTNLIFTYQEQVLQNGVFTADDTMPSKITITATSAYNSSLNYSFEVRVLEPLDLSNVLVKHDETELVPNSQDDYLEIITNSDKDYIKKLTLLFDVANNYKYKVVSQNGLLHIQEDNEAVKVEGAYNFTIQQERETADRADYIVVKISHDDFLDYTETLKYKVVLKSAPQFVKVNGVSVHETINLYNNGEVGKQDLALSVYPSNATYNHIYLEFYIGTTKVNYENLKEYLSVRYKGYEIVDGMEISDFSSTIQIFGKKVLEGENAGKTIYIRAICNSDYVAEGAVYAEVPVVINRSASVFRVDSKYINSTIYVYKNTDVIFSGFVIGPDDAYVGNVMFVPDAGSVGYVNLSQEPSVGSTLSIRIKSNKVGEATYTLVLTSGISTKITIRVKETLNLNNFKINIDSSASNAIGEVKYKDNGLGTLESVWVRGVNSKFSVTELIDPVDADLFEIKYDVNSADRASVDVTKNTITALKVISGGVVVNVKITIYSVTNFQLGSIATPNTAFSFTVYCFIPITSFTATAKNNGQTLAQSNFVSVFNKQTVGYMDRILSEIQIYTSLSPADAKFNDILWSFSVYSEMEIDNGKTRYILSSSGNRYGYFYPEEKLFVCDSDSSDDLLVGNIFQIYATVNEYGKTYTSMIQITIEKYIKVDRVWLYNYTPSIYLDAINSEEIIYPYILPANASNKNFTVWFEVDSGSSSSLLQIENDSTYIKLKYSGAGAGTGILHIIPIAKYEDGFGTFSYSLQIPIIIADGTKEAPLHIRTLEDFKNINTVNGLKKHYIIDSIIDAKGETLSTMGVLHGSISGASNAIYPSGISTVLNENLNIGGIINFKIDNPNNGNLGLFSEIAATGIVNNLILQGSINLNLSLKSVENIGLLCGVNNGLIRNVSITLLSSAVTVSGTNMVNVGGVAGFNSGVIVTDTIERRLGDVYLNISDEIVNGNKISPEYNNSGVAEYMRNYAPAGTLMVHMPETAKFELIVNSLSFYEYNFGGICGNNAGLIKLRSNITKRYNYYGISAVVYLATNADNSGAVCGKNSGNISSVIVTGSLKGANHVGGICGYMSIGIVTNCTSRVFLTGENYIAGLVGILSSGSVSDSLVEAIDDGKKIGLNASLIYSNQGTKVDNVVNNETGNALNVTNTKALSYITRTKIPDTTTVLTTTDTYFGEKLIVNSQGIIEAYTFEKADAKNISACLKEYEAILFYYKAKNYENQAYLSTFNISELPSSLFIGATPEIMISSENSSILNTLTNGQLSILGTGKVVLKLTNSLNARDYALVTIYITNYAVQLQLYTNSDKEGLSAPDGGIINVSNRNSQVLYPGFATDIISSGNMIIELVENQELQLEIMYTGTYVNVLQNGKSIIITGNNLNDSGTENIEFVAYYQNGTFKRYLENGAFVNTPTNRFNLNINYTRGIYEIMLDKNNITAVPSDVITLRLVYRTDNINDNISITMQDETNGVTINVSESSIAEFNKYFTYTVSEAKKLNAIAGDNQYYIDYTFKMNQDNINSGIFNFIFKSSDERVYKKLRVNYIDQPILNVMVKNYSAVSNENIELQTEASGNVVFNTSYTMNETNEVTAGEANILRVYISPAYAEYSFVEITNFENNSTMAQFSLLKQYQAIENGAVVSSEGYYTALGIRVEKQHIKEGDLLILYKIPTNVTEGQTISLQINFYDKDGNLAYETIVKNLTITMKKSVNVSIANKTAKDNAYRVARGYEYLLNVTSTGYAADEIVVSVTSPHAEIIKREGSYYLKISDNITYGASGNEGVVFEINSYGQKYVNGKLEKSKTSTIVCVIVEYIIDDLDVRKIFEDNVLNIKIGNRVNITELIVENLNIEFASDAINAVEKFKTDLKKNATWWYKINSDIFVELLADTNETSNGYVLINGRDVTPIKITDTVPYSFGISALLSYENGYVVVKPFAKDEEDNEINQDLIMNFEVIVSQSSSENSPWPIYTYEDLQKMADGGYYRLMNNITLPEDFVPLETKVKFFDGNSYKLEFNGMYVNYSNMSGFGIFKVIEKNSIVKNLNICISGTTKFEFDNNTNASPLLFGLLTSVNNGIITNCMVSYVGTATLSISNLTPVAVSNLSYVSALCAENNGYITNSNVSVKIESTGANLSAFVANNKGKISSCFVKNSNIKNSGTVNSVTGGFVVLNSGSIFGSYITGTYADAGYSKIYADNSAYIIQASYWAGGFAYNNTGTITDSYSNIPIISSSRNAGFVAMNSAVIERCYSSSMLGSADTENFPFFISKTDSGKFINCYFLKDTGININTSQSNDTVEGITKLTLQEFSDINNFNDFVANKNNDVSNGVWFMPVDALKETSAAYKDKYTYSYQVTYDSYTYRGEKQTFIARRPELVSANTLAYSVYRIQEDKTEINPETGETIYHYIISDSNATEGSRYNPILVYDTASLENNITNTSSNFVNRNYFRTLCDIDYIEDQISISKLYNHVFAGYFEGNSFTIKNFSINNGENALNGGFFAQVGNGVNFAVVQNLKLVPKYINLPNSYNVGTLAGTLNKGYIYNVSAGDESNASQSIIILGRDIVGGLFGRTVSMYDINTVGSSISANAYLTNSAPEWDNSDVLNQITYSESRGNYYDVSYAGGMIGYVGGSGSVRNVSINSPVAAIGMFAGLAFGGIGYNASVKEVNITLHNSNQNFVRASAFGGILSGEVKGLVSDVNVNFDGTLTLEQIQAAIIFKTEPRLPIAIGGLTGIMNGGTISDSNINADVKLETVATVGGAVGRMTDGTLEKISFNGDVSAKMYSGGLIGYADITKEIIQGYHTYTNIKIENCYVGKQTKISNITVKKPSSEDINNVYVGGFIGCVKIPSYGADSREGMPTTFDGGIKLGVTNAAYVKLIANVSDYGTKNIDFNGVDVAIHSGGLIGGIESNFSLTDNEISDYPSNVFSVKAKTYIQAVMSSGVNILKSIDYEINYSNINSTNKLVGMKVYYAEYVYGYETNTHTTSVKSFFVNSKIPHNTFNPIGYGYVLRAHVL